MCQTCLQRTIPEFGLPPLVPVTPVAPDVCDSCAEEALHPGYTETPVGHLCQDCYNRDYANCDNCSNVVERDDLCATPGGDGYCEECYNEVFCSCDHCGDTIVFDDSHSSEDGRNGPYCQSCYDNRYCRCDGCSCEVRRDSAYHADGDDYCQDCYCDHYSTCDDCGDECYRDSMYYNDNGSYCESCFPRNSGCEGKKFHFRDSDTTVRTGSLRTFGVELETSSCDGYEDMSGETYFTSKPDGSITGEEFVSGILRGDRGLAACEEFCGLANGNGFKVDAACGFHLHIGCQDLTETELKAVCIGYKLTERLWQSFMPRSRRENSYCAGLSWTCDDMENAHFSSFAARQDRYQWFNIRAYNDHRTLEVRLHTATLDARKVCNWIAAHVKFTDYLAKRTVAQVYAEFGHLSSDEMFAKFAEIVGADVAEFYRARAGKWGTHYATSAAALVA